MIWYLVARIFLQNACLFKISLCSTKKWMNLQYFVTNTNHIASYYQ